MIARAKSVLNDFKVQYGGDFHGGDAVVGQSVAQLVFTHSYIVEKFTDMMRGKCWCPMFCSVSAVMLPSEDQPQLILDGADSHLKTKYDSQMKKLGLL